jgi:hypothetical protein
MTFDLTCYFCDGAGGHVEGYSLVWRLLIVGIEEDGISDHCGSLGIMIRMVRGEERKVAWLSDCRARGTLLVSI